MVTPSLLVDLRVAQVNRDRGIPRYSQGLVLALAHDRPELDIACLVDPDQVPPLRIGELATHCRIVESAATLQQERRRITHFLQCGTFYKGIPLRSRFPAELAVFRPRLGAIVYDLIPWLFPHAYLTDPGDSNDYFGALPILSALDMVFAISESVRRDTIAIANTDPARVVTIYGGLDEERWASLETHAAPGNVVNGLLHIRNDAGDSLRVPAPFWLYVGGDDFRKNVPRLIQAVGLLKKHGRLRNPLVVVCSMGPARQRELLAFGRSVGLRPGVDVIFAGHVSDEMLAHLFGNCLASVFPSLYEGLGLPILESYRFGKAAIASDTSALRELVPASCRFDPYDVASISDTMRRFQEDESLAQDSLATAQEAMNLCRWPDAARRLGDWLDEPAASSRLPARKRPMWIAAALPPDRSGVAVVTQHSLGAPDAPVTFFTPVRGAVGLEAARQSLALTRHGLQREAAPADVLSLTTLADAQHRLARQPVLFVLGNSSHHLDTLAFLLEHGARLDDAVHLHDVFIGGLLTLHFGTDGGLEMGLLDGYPAEVVSDWVRGGGAVQGGAGSLLGPRLLVRRAGVRHFIVNSAAAAARLQADLGEDVSGIRIEVLFLPILPSRFNPSAHNSKLLRIGHFGILQPGKHPDRLVAACDLLARRHRIELVLAGYDVNAYVRRHKLEREYLRVQESPTDYELEEIMSTVDCAVQLRYPDHGESSGVVNQLLALRRPVICTRAGSFAELDGVVKLVPPDVSPGALAEAIERTVTSGPSAALDEFIARRTPEIFEKRLRQILGLDSDIAG